MGKSDSEVAVTNDLANLQVVKSTVDATGEHKLEGGSHVQDNYGQEFLDLDDSLARARQTLSQSSPLGTSLEIHQDTQGSSDGHCVGISAGQLKYDPNTIVTTEDELKKSSTNSLFTPNPSSDTVGIGTADSGEDSSVPLVDLDPGGAISMSYSSRTCSSHSIMMVMDDESCQENIKTTSEGPFQDLEVGLPASSSPHVGGDGKDKKEARQPLSEVKVYPDVAAASGDDKHYLCIDIDSGKGSGTPTEDLLEKEGPSVGDGKSNTDNIENSISELSGLRRRRGTKVNSFEGGGRILDDDKALSAHAKDSPVSSGMETRTKPVEKKGLKQAKAKGTQVEKDSSSQQAGKAVLKKGIETPSIEELRAKDIDDRKVQESLDTFIRQTIGREPYMSFASRPGDKPMPRIIRPDVFDHHAVANKLSKGLRVEVDMRDSVEDNANVDSHQDSERDPSGNGAKGGGGLGRGLQGPGDRNLHGLKNTVPQAMAAFAQAAAAAKNTDLPGWPLLSPSKVQLQKCDKCSREFCSPFNHRRHSRTHRRMPHVDKEDLSTKRRNVAAFWDKLNPEEAQQIVSSRTFDVEDLSGESAVRTLTAFMSQNNSNPMPPAFMKAGQDLLDIVDNRGGVFPLSAKQLLNVLDEASERNFLCGEQPLAVQKYVYQGDAGKIGLEDKNLVASLGFIVEQTLVKAWMADKDAEALRNQQELVKEEEAAQIKRERHVQEKKKKKKREKNRQKGLKERKGSVSRLALHELENESVDEEGASPEIVDEDNSPTASSTSRGSSGHDNNLAEPLEMEIGDQAAHVEASDETLSLEVNLVLKPKVVSPLQLHHKQPVPGDRQSFAELSSAVVYVDDSLPKADPLDEDRDYDLVSNDEEEERPSVSQSSLHAKPIKYVGHKSDYDQRRTSQRLNKDPTRGEISDYSSYQRPGRDSRTTDIRFQEEEPQLKLSRKPTTGPTFSPRSETVSNPLFGFSTAQHYRSKPVGSSRSSPFQSSPHGVWTRKTQQPVPVDIGKETKEDENVQTDSKSGKDVKEVAVEILSAVRQPDSEAAASGSKVDKEEARCVEKRDIRPAPVTPVPKLFASVGANMVNTQSCLFDIEANSDEWPLLPQRSTSLPAFNPKNTTGLQTVAANSTEHEARALNKRSSEKDGAETKLEGSCGEIPPSVGQTVDEAQAEVGTVSSGILVGSVPVPLGTFTTPTRTGSVTLANRANALPSIQFGSPSYTAILVAPAVKHTRESAPVTEIQQRVHETIEPEVSQLSDEQSNNMCVGPGQYRGGPYRTPPLMNLTPKHMKVPLNPAMERGERGSLLKQAVWSSAPGRFPAPKVWRPVRCSGENTDPVLGGLTGNEGHPTGSEGRGTTESIASERTSRGLSGGEYVQVGEAETSTAQILPSSMSARGEDVEDRSGSEECREERVDNINCGIGEPKQDPDVDSGVSEQVAYSEEISVPSPVVEGLDSEEVVICEDTSEEEADVNIIEYRTYVKGGDERTFVDSVPNHSAWISEATEYHHNRWIKANDYKETVRHMDDEDRPELLTTKWVEFLNNLPPVPAQQIQGKRSQHLSKVFTDLDLVEGKALSQTVDEQRMYAQDSGQDSSGGGAQALSSDEEALRDASPCGSEHYHGGGEGRSCTPGEVITGSQNLESRGDGTMQVGVRSGNSSSSAQERWHRTSRERLPEQRYIPRQRCPAEKT